MNSELLVLLYQFVRIRPQLVAGLGIAVIDLVQALVLLVFTVAEHEHDKAREDDQGRHAPDEDHQRRRHDQRHPVRERAAEDGGEKPHGGLQPPPLHGGGARREPLGLPEAPEERGEDGARAGDEGQVPRVAARQPRRPGQAAGHDGDGGDADDQGHEDEQRAAAACCLVDRPVADLAVADWRIARSP
uniref:Uncharacterized protein n=1 Tax=Setaria italica TaxID=4555 RepID=K3Z9Y8_SETIT